jgi:retrograde regulation protein 2
VSDLLKAAVPEPGERKIPQSISSHVIRAFANFLYVHSTMSKETASTAALYSTSTGVMSSTHGVTHADRALLALMLQARYDSNDLPPRDDQFKTSLQEILTPEEVWWTRYIGEIGQLICTVYPAGIVDQKAPRIEIRSEWASDFGKDGDKEGLRLFLSIKRVEDDPLMLKQTLEEIWIGGIEKVGKEKNWKGWGISIDIVIKEVKEFN